MRRLSGSITSSFSRRFTAWGLAPTKYWEKSFLGNLAIDWMKVRAWREDGGRTEWLGKELFKKSELKQSREAYCVTGNLVKKLIIRGPNNLKDSCELVNI